MKTKYKYLLLIIIFMTPFGETLFGQIKERKIPPKIVSSMNITSPQDNKQVNSPLIIEGTSAKNAKIEVNVESTFTGGSQDLGTFKTNANSSGIWSTTPINLWVPENAKNVKFKISALQTGNNSTPIEITVLPPQKVKTVAIANINPGMITQLNQSAMTITAPLKISKKKDLMPVLQKATALPEITSPSHQAVITTPLVVKGTARRGSMIEVIIESNIPQPDKNSYVMDAEVDENGNWKTPPINLWLFEDATDVRFTITAYEKLLNTNKNLISKKITIIPSIDQNFPRHPVKPWDISVGPKSGSNVESPMVVKGSAGKQRTVQIVISSYYTDSKGKKIDLPKINTSTTSDQNGKFESNPIILPAPKTESLLTHNIYVNQVGLGEVSGNTSVKVTSDPKRVEKPHIKVRGFK